MLLLNLTSIDTAAIISTLIHIEAIHLEQFLLCHLHYHFSLLKISKESVIAYKFLFLSTFESFEVKEASIIFRKYDLQMAS